jgi:hypothetical protein
MAGGRAGHQLLSAILTCGYIRGTRKVHQRSISGPRLRACTSAAESTPVGPCRARGAAPAVSQRRRPASPNGCALPSPGHGKPSRCQERAVARTAGSARTLSAIRPQLPLQDALRRHLMKQPGARRRRPATPHICSARAVSAGGGRCWVRTNEGLADGFTDRRLWQQLTLPTRVITAGSAPIHHIWKTSPRGCGHACSDEPGTGYLSSSREWLDL